MVSSENLELCEHRSFQERFWTVQRYAWVGYGIIIAAALMGFSGESGVFARAHVEAGRNAIDHPRFARWQTQEILSIAFAPTSRSERSVLLSSELARQLSIEGVHPSPWRSTAAAVGEEHVFLVRPGESGMVKIRMKPDTPGILRGTIAIDGVAAGVKLIILP